MASSLPGRLAASAGLLFLALLGGGFTTYALVGAVDGAPAAAFADALEQNGRMAQLSGYLHAAAGLALAAFVAGVLTGPTPGAALAAGRFAGFAWAASFILGGAVIFASAELANYQQHPEGAKTALVLGHLLYANSIAALLGGGFALAVGLARPAALPAWFRPFSLVLGGLTMAATLPASAFGIGLVSMGPLVLWLIVTAVVVPWRAWRAPKPAAR